MMDVKVGDEVRVFDVNGRRMGQPDGGWPATVTKIGRKYFVVAFGGRHGAFNLTNGVINDNYGHKSVRTLAQAEETMRRAKAVATLHENGIEIRPGHRHTLEQLEALAEVARIFKQED